MKKTFLALLALSVSGAALAACGTGMSNQSVTPTISKKNFAYGAVTSMSLASSKAAPMKLMEKINAEAVETGGSTSSDSDTTSSTPSDTPTSSVEANETLEGFLPTADLFLEGKGSPNLMESLESDNLEYAFKERLVFTDLKGDTSEFLLYYNSVASSDWGEIDGDNEEENDDEENENLAEDDEDKDEKADDDSDDIEEDDDEYTFKEGKMLQGIIIHDIDTYHFESKIMTVTEEDETSKEIAIRMSGDATYSSFVSVTYEQEEEDGKKEESFDYEVYDNGTLTLAYEVDLPTSEEQEVDIEIGKEEFAVTLLSSYNEKDGHFLKVTKEDDSFMVYERLSEGENFTYSLLS